MTNMSSAVELSQVTKRFGKHVAVDHLDLTVPMGAVYGFIGPNGSGKTTTLRVILRIFHPDEGDVKVLGQERLSAADDRVSYLPEERGLYKKMKVRDILAFYAQLKGMRNCRAEIDTGWSVWSWPSGPTSAWRRCPKACRKRSSSLPRSFPSRS